MKICKQCNAAQADEARFCNLCGAEMTGDEEVLHYLQKLSEPYGTKIEIKDGVGTIQMEA